MSDQFDFTKNNIDKIRSLIKGSQFINDQSSNNGNEIAFVPIIDVKSDDIEKESPKNKKEFKNIQPVKFLKQQPQVDKSTNNDKSQFINKLLDISMKTNIDNKSKEKLIQLIGKEIEKTGNVENELLDRMISLESKIDKIMPPPPDRIVIKKHSPKTMVSFLQKFSKDDSFKWFTHNPDLGLESFNYFDYLKNADINYKSITGWNINDLTYSNVRNFIFDTGYKCRVFGEEDFKFTWRDVKIWCDNNPNVHPYFAELEGCRFNKYIEKFKYQILEFRNDNPWFTFDKQLESLFKREISNDIKIIFDDKMNFKAIAKSLNIYIDINLLFSAIKQIISWVNINKSKSDKFTVNLLDSGDFYVLDLFHENSFISLDSKSDKLNGLAGDFEKVRKFLFCVADWNIYADLKHDNKSESCKIICLDENTQLTSNEKKTKTLTLNTIEPMQEPVNGVRHILKLYKTQNL